MQDVLQAGRGGDPEKAWTSTHFPFTALAIKTTFFLPSSCIPLNLNASTSIEPSLPSLPPSSPFLSSLHPSWSYFDSGLSLFHPPSSQPQPFSSQPQFPIDLLIAVCLWESGRSLPLLSPCMDLSSLSPPFFSLSLHPLHLPIDAASLKHELEKAGESNLPGEIGFTFSSARFFFLPCSLSLIHLSFSTIFCGLFCIYIFFVFFCLLILSVLHFCTNAVARSVLMSGQQAF